MPLADRRSAGNADHDVGELPAARLAHAEPTQLDALDAGDRGPSGVLDVVRHAVHQHVHVAAHETNGSDDHEHCDEERCDGVALGMARAREGSPMSTAVEPARSLPKCSAFDSSAALSYFRAARNDRTMRLASTPITTRTTANTHQASSSSGGS